MIHQLKITGEYQAIISTCPAGLHILILKCLPIMHEVMSLTFATGNSYANPSVLVGVLFWKDVLIDTARCSR